MEVNVVRFRIGHGESLAKRSRRSASDQARRVVANIAKLPDLLTWEKPMNGWVHTLEWSSEAKEFRVVKVPRPSDTRWCHYENYWDAHAVAVRWNEALRRHYKSS